MIIIFICVFFLLNVRWNYESFFCFWDVCLSLGGYLNGKLERDKKVDKSTRLKENISNYILKVRF